MQHVFGRVYYPCTPKRKWWQPISGISWLPGIKYAYGKNTLVYAIFSRRGHPRSFWRLLSKISTHFLTSQSNSVIPHNSFPGLSTFIFFRRPRGWLYWIAKQIIFLVTLIFGRLQRIELHHGAPLARLPTRLPVVIFSHGLGGNRAVYSIICSELASHGYVVFALEHADGTASCCKLAGDKGYRFYRGLGGDEGQVEKTRHRVQEMKTAVKVMRALHKGENLHGLKL